MSHSSLTIVSVMVFTAVLPLLFVSTALAEPDQLTIVMTKFQGPDPTMYPVENVFHIWLTEICNDYDWISISRHSESVPFDNIDPFTGDSAGLAIGREVDADILLWGAYVIEGDSIPSFLAASISSIPDLSLIASMGLRYFTDANTFTKIQIRNPGPAPDIFRFAVYSFLSNYYLQANEFEKSFEFTQLALEYSETAESMNIAACHLNMATTLRILERLDEAYQHIEQAILYSPFQSDILRDEKARIELDMMDAGITIPSLRDIEGIPETANDCYHMAVSLDNKGEYEQALQLYNAGIELAETDSMLASIYLDRALCNTLLNDYDAALTDAISAVDYDPSNPMAQCRLGEIYYDLGRYEEALPHLETSIAVSESEFMRYYAIRQRGMCYLRMGERTQGIADLQSIIGSNLWEPPNMEMYGIALRYEGDNESAIQYITEAIDNGFESDEGYANRGIALAKLGYLEEGLADLDRAIELETIDEERAILFFERSTIEIELGMYADAIQNVDSCLVYYPDMADCYFWRGLARAHAGYLVEAKTDFEQCLLMPEESFTHDEIREIIAQIEAAML